jgi:hypothetical protein
MSQKNDLKKIFLYNFLELIIYSIPNIKNNKTFDIDLKIEFD